MGRWTGEGGQAQAPNTGHLGYLPADVAAEMIEQDEEFRFGATVVTMFMPRRGKSPGLRLDLWCPRSKRQEQE